MTVRLIDRIRKPEYLFRPSLLYTRFTRSKHRGRTVTGTPWKLDLSIDPGEEIGKALLRRGVYDLPVSEAIWRLLIPGEHAIDVGANFGCMTSIMAARVGRQGKVTTFEPHPELFPILESNITRWRKYGADGVRAHRVALSNRIGTASLYIPETFQRNCGRSSLVESKNAKEISVEVTRLDRCLSSVEPIALLKIDVEGHELQVLEGSDSLLRSPGVRDIIFEEFRKYPTEVSAFLESRGYVIYQLGMTFWGPMLSRVQGPCVARRQWEPQSMLATREPTRARSLLTPRGWQILRATRDRMQSSNVCAGKG